MNVTALSELMVQIAYNFSLVFSGTLHIVQYGKIKYRVRRW